MSQKRLEWKVGLFVLIGLALVATLLIGFSKGLTFFSPTYTILLRSGNAGGLKPHASVLMSGVQVGTVSDIRLAPDGKTVTITLRIYNEYRIHSDARFVIEQSGFLGDQFVAIVPTRNEGDIFGPGRENIATAEAPFNLQEFTRSASGFITRIDDTVKKLNDALVDVTRVVLNPQNLTNLSVAVANLREFSDQALTTVTNLNQLVTVNGPALHTSSSNLVAFSEQMTRFSGGLNQLLETNSPQVHSAVKNIESSTETLNSLLSDVKAGKGLAGDVLQNQQAATTMNQILNNLSITSSNLNRLGLWGILWKHKPPKTNAPAPIIESPKEKP